MKEIQLSQGKVALVDDEDFEYLNQSRWFVSLKGKTYYAGRNRSRKIGKTIIWMHREIKGFPEGMSIDHIDHNGLNNQKSNLRVCTHSENLYNTSSRKDSSSQFLGVSWFRRDSNWRATIKKGCKWHHIGYFDLETDAALAYNHKALELFGEFANLNIIDRP